MGKWKKLNSNKFKQINESKFVVDWDAPCRSKFQKEVKNQLKKLRGLDYWLEEFPVPGTRMTLDFVNLTKNWALEADGAQHLEYNPFFHNNNVQNFIGQLKRDNSKEKWCEQNNLILIRVYPEDLPLTNEFFEPYL